MISLIIGAELLLSPYLRQETGNFYERVPEFSKQIRGCIKAAVADCDQRLYINGTGHQEDTDRGRDAWPSC